MPEQKSSYETIKARLDQIVGEVQKKDTPLEKSLDLYDEALRLGNRCVELLDSTDFSLNELEQADDAADGAASVAEPARGTATDPQASQDTPQAKAPVHDDGNKPDEQSQAS
ncbi:MAG: exodeoxyribonuclease VII small subunit [Coriobacteriales bacterium]|jgi:exodeoxyribonuclease VII small subunit|nr:exodeoxyribonuclease VII small subunit [Coriobacteriales bacterium]